MPSASSALPAFLRHLIRALPLVGALLLGAVVPLRATDVVITEAMSAGDATDWIELTNTGTTVVSLSGWKMDDNSFASASSVPLVGVASLAPGESAVFVEGTATNATAMKATWGLGASVQVGSYTGSSVGLSSSTDGVIVFDASATEISRQSFGLATSGTSFHWFANNSSAALSGSGGDGAYNPAGSLFGSPGKSTGSAPDAPTVSAATAVTASGFTASFAAAGTGTAATGLYLDVSTASDNFAAGTLINASGTTAQTLGIPLVGGATSQAITGLSGGTAYVYRVRGVSLGGSGSYSASQAVSTLGPPAAPTVGAAGSVLTTSASATWTAAGSGDAATGFRVELIVDGGSFASGSFIGSGGITGQASGVAVGGGGSTAQAFTGLLSSTTYRYRVIATNAQGDSPASGEQTFTTAVAPTGVVITEAMSSGDATDWFELTNYGTTVVSLTGWKMDDNSFASGSSVPMVGVTSLAPGESAVFVEGTVTNATAMKATWGLGASVQVGSYTGSSVGLSSSTDGVIVFNASATEISRQSFGAATNGTSFRWSSNNSSAALSVNGSNGASNPSGSLIGSPGKATGDTTPSAPTVSAASAITGSGFTATFAAAVAGSAVTGLYLDVSTASDNFAAGTLISASGTTAQTVGIPLVFGTTSQAISGLSAGTAYIYRVRGLDLGGSGSYSASQAVSTLAPPAAPTVGAATGVSSSGAGATWTAAGSGDAATGFRVELIVDGGSFTSGSFISAAGVGGQTSGVAVGGGASTSQAFTGLLSSTAYRYRVIATNAQGDSPASGEQTFTTSTALASVVITEAMSAGDATDWIELTNTGTTVVSLSGWKMDDNSFASASSVPLVGVTGLAPGESAVFVEGSASNAMAMKATWGLGASVQVGSYTGSGVGLSGTADGVIVFDASATEISRQSFAAATNGTSFRWSSNNSSAALSVNGSNGASNPSGALIGSPGKSTGDAAPDAPTVSAATSITTSGFTANFVVAGTGTAATALYLDVSTASDNFAAGTLISASGTTAQAVGTPLTPGTISQAISGLSAGTAYVYRVRGLDLGGSGAYSASQAVTTTAPPSAPDAPTAGTASGVLSTSANATWTAAGSGSAATGFRVELIVDGGSFTSGSFIAATGATGQSSGVVVSGGASVSQAFTNLLASTTYRYRVFATNAQGDSAASGEQTFTTSAPTSTNVAGDLALIAMWTDNEAGDPNPELFAFVTLAAIPGNAVVYFTDRGWNGGTSAFQSNTDDSTLAWTAPSAGLPPGVIVVIASDAQLPAVANPSIGTVSGNMLSLSNSSDQVIAYQGADQNSPSVFLYAMTFNGAFLSSGTPSAGTTWLPTGLSTASPITAVALANRDNQAYAGSTVQGTKTALLDAIGVATDWSRNNNTFPQPPVSFTVQSGTTPPGIARVSDAVGAEADGGARSLNGAFTVSSSGVISNMTFDTTSAAVTGSAGGTLGGGSIDLTFTPAGAGTAALTIAVEESDGGKAWTSLPVAVSAAVGGTWYRGAADASAAELSADATHALVFDDEDQVARLYAVAAGGTPVSGSDPTASLGLTDLTAGELPTNPAREVDFEASVAIGGSLYVLGSQSNSSSGSDRPNRRRLVKYTPGGDGAATTVAYAAAYSFLRDDLLAWDAGSGAAQHLGLTASAASGGNGTPEDSALDGFNIEGLTVGSDGTSGWVAFRAPLVGATSAVTVADNSATVRTHALIVPITNLAGLPGLGSGSAVVGTPIRLDLGGRGIREIRRIGTQYVLIAGPSDGATGTPPKDFRLYQWDGSVNGSGQATGLVQLATSLASFTAPNFSGSPEALTPVVNGQQVLTAASSVRLWSDCGDADYYGLHLAAKLLPFDGWKKFRSDTVILGSANAPVVSGLEGTVLTATAGGTAPALSATLAVSDADNLALAGATVSITAGFHVGGDVLAFTDTAAISGSWDGASGVLTLSGDASLADYQAALRSVTFTDASGSPSTGTRIISVVVGDGVDSSTAATRQATVALAGQTIDGFTAFAAHAYGEAAFDLTGITGGGSGNPVVFTSGDTAVATVSGTTVTIVGAGTAEITATQAGGGIYADAAPVAQTLTVSPATLTVTADDLMGYVGDPRPTLTFSATGWVAGEGPGLFTGAVATTASATLTAGTFAITQGTLAAPNYAITFTAGELLVVANSAPVLSVPAVQAITLGDGQALAGSCSDADEAAHGQTVAVSWSLVSGPGTFAFATPGDRTSAVRFDRDGTYVLRLTANDGHATVARSLTAIVSLPGTVVVDNAMAPTAIASFTATGAWSTSSIKGVAGTTTLYTGQPATAATWSATLPAGWYQVGFWKVLDGAADKPAKATLHHADGDSTVLLDAADVPAGWVDLGSVRSDGSAPLHLTATRTVGTLRIDAVRFIALPGEIIDHGLAGYAESGAWASSTAEQGLGGSTTRYSKDAAATVSWTATSGGERRVLLQRVLNPNNDAAWSALLDLGAAPVSYAVAARSGAEGWADLGRHTIAAGDALVLSHASTKVLRADAVRFARDTVVDNGDPGCREESVTWATSGLPGQGGSTVRFSASKTAAVTWRASLAPGRYRVWWYRIAYSSSPSDVQVAVSHDAGATTTVEDLRTGASGWRELGSFDFSTGTGQVRATRGTLDTTPLRVDAVRFEPLGDAAPVTVVPGGGPG